MKDSKLFKEYMTGLGEIHDKKITDVLKNVYWKTLEPFTDDQCKKAFDDIMASSKWFPKPAEIILAINKDVAKIEDRAIVEANKILIHLNLNGAGKWPALDDPITKHLMTSRWVYDRWARDVLESELKWWVKEFIEAYRAYSETEAPLQIEVSDEIKPLVNDIGKPIESKKKIRDQLNTEIQKILK